MKRRGVTVLLVVVLVVILAALALPVVNLIVGLPENSLTTLKSDDPRFRKICAILGKKCANCHSEEYTLPFYASFPIAKGIIEADIHEGTHHIDLLKELRDSQPPTEVTLARIEWSTEQNTMPPLRYLLLHWNGALSEKERRTILTWIQETRKKHYAAPDVAEEFRGEVVQPLPRAVKVDPEKAALGKLLYNDTRLSKDSTVSCATCHDLAKGGTDQAPVSTGVGGAKGPINAPTVFNAAYQIAQFWDSRAATLEEQAKGPVENPLEMADSWPKVVEELKQDAELVKKFARIYPQGITPDTVVAAIAEFERTVITPDAPFDRYLRGEKEALSAQALSGYKLFKAEGCATCHVGKLLGGRSYEVMGHARDYFADRGNVKEADMGRFNVTQREEDRHRFKVPTLRNVTLTAPYFHDARTSDLSEAVKIMAEYQLDTELSEEAVKHIVAFLESLTGTYKE